MVFPTGTGVLGEKYLPLAAVLLQKESRTSAEFEAAKNLDPKIWARLVGVADKGKNLRGETPGARFGQVRLFAAERRWLLNLSTSEKLFIFMEMLAS